MYAGHRFLDVLIHGWDLAVATGQDPILDPGLAQECWLVVEPQSDMLRASGMFGQAIDPVDPVDSGDTPGRLLAILGRTPTG